MATDIVKNIHNGCGVVVGRSLTSIKVRLRKHFRNGIPTCRKLPVYSTYK